jgi:mono/diheme cytochrome c family protein
MNRAQLVFWTAAILLAATIASWSQMSPAEQRGRTFAQANCSNCHSIDKVSPSPLPIAPPFRELHDRYPVERLEEALGEGIVTGHPNMPEFRLAPDQIGNFIAFLKSLER